MLAELVEVVIGVDTHKDTHTAAVVAASTGAVLGQTTVTANPAGYDGLLELAQLVRAKLELEWSPEQIAAHLRVAHPDRRDWHLCHETIYQGL